MTESRTLTVFFFTLITLYSACARCGTNLEMDGTLVTEPCNLDPGDNKLTVSFGTIIKKGLYKEPRTFSKPFRVTLSDCDTTLGKSVTLTFTGTESQATGMKGYLSTTGPGSEGIVIGIEKPDGTPVKINEPTTAWALRDGVTEIQLQAYVQATPEALQNQSLEAGDFSATATLDVGYP
ncbi:TPA: fimbrial protein [Klebsiella aerogenes]|nr:fimbrial protein [Klebsiella aerogenes]